MHVVCSAVSGSGVRVFLNPGDFHCTTRDVVLRTVLGTCISVCLRDDVAGVSGMNHFMMPSTEGQDPGQSRAGLYGDTAMDLLVAGMERMGAKRERLRARIYGGAKLGVGMTTGARIADANLAAAERYLERHGIPTFTRHVGGSRARKITFDTVSGVVAVTLISANTGVQGARYEPRLATAAG